MPAALDRLILNDFMNCRIRMSFKLFGIAHRKNSTVTMTNGSSRPAGINWASMSSFLFSEGELPGPTELLKVSFSSWNERCNETPEPMLLLRQIDLQRDADIGDLFDGHLNL